MYCNKKNVNILTSLLVKYGVRHVVCCPGSRNAALVHNFNECPQLECHPVTDERSASFVALGMRLELHEPVAVCVTSGSALLNTLPAVAEASYQHQPIIVISADRPSRFINQLDGQTINQSGALGEFVCATATVTDDDCHEFHRAMLLLEHTGRSIHVNVPLEEPLFEFTVPELPEVRRVGYLSSLSNMPHLSGYQRPMLIIGQMEQDSLDEELVSELEENCVVISEQLSVVREGMPALDSVFRSFDWNNKAFSPDLIIYIGGNTISKQLRLWLRSVEGATIVMHNEHGLLEDPSLHATWLVTGSAYKLLNVLNTTLQDTDLHFIQMWRSLILTVSEQTRESYDTLEEAAVYWLEKNLTDEDRVYYANSSSVRLGARYSHRFFQCNRGVNGIEGSLSTAVGASLVSGAKVYCVIGDLSFFYDQNALWNQYLCGNLRILLLNNGGGAIFRKLPGLSSSPAAEELIGASHRTSASGICETYHVEYRQTSSPEELPLQLEWLTTDEPTDRPMLLEILL